MDGDLPLTPGQRRVLAVYRRRGPRFLVRTITLASVLLSVTLVGAGVLIARPALRSAIFDLGVAVLVPLVVAPVMSTVSVNLLGAVARAHDELHVIASTDALTGLANRRRFFEQAALMTRELTDDGTLLVCMVDLNWFKQINDTWGHAIGDAALVAVGQRLRQAAGPGAVVGRLGGDEFACLVPGPAEPAAVKQALVAAGREIMVGEDVTVSASVGFARITAGTGIDAALALADAELYLVKQQRVARATPARGPGRAG